MFQVALRRTLPVRKLHREIFLPSLQRAPGLRASLRLLSSQQLPPWKELRKQQITAWDSCRIAPSNGCLNLSSTTYSYIIQDGVTIAPLGVQRRWFSDKKQSNAQEKQEPGRLSRIVPALRQRVTDFNTGDLMSVYVIFVFILVIIFSPFIAK